MICNQDRIACLPFTWANRSGQGQVNFVPERTFTIFTNKFHSPKNGAKAGTSYQRWLSRNGTRRFPIGTFCQENWATFSDLPLKRPKKSCAIYFPKYWIPEFWATFSYGLLLQRFFWNSSGIFIMLIKADTGNFCKKLQQLFFTRRDFLWTEGSF